MQNSSFSTLDISILMFCCCKLLKEYSVNLSYFIKAYIAKILLIKISCVFLRCFVLSSVLNAAKTKPTQHWNTNEHNLHVMRENVCILKLRNMLSIAHMWWSAQFRKCLIQLVSCRDISTINGNVNQTTERVGLTNESHTGEMSAIAAQIPAAGPVQSKPEEQPSECSLFGQLPIPENKVCPMWGQQTPHDFSN